MSTALENRKNLSKQKKKKAEKTLSEKLEGTDRFKRTIEDYLKGLAAKDPLFAKTLQKPNKGMDECIYYILKQVMLSKRNGFTNTEIYKLAIHYWDEDGLKVDQKEDFSSMGIAVNHVNLTAEEQEEAKEKAIRELIDEQKAKLKNKKDSPAKEESKGNLGEQASMF